MTAARVLRSIQAPGVAALLVLSLASAAAGPARAQAQAQPTQQPERDEIAAFRDAAEVHVEATVMALAIDPDPAARRLAALVAASRLQRQPCRPEHAIEACVALPGHARVRERLHDGLDAAPDDPLLHWVAAQDPSLPREQRLRLAGRLAVLEPHNAAVWLLRLQGVDGATASEVDAVLAAVADARSHSLYTGERMRGYLQAFETLPLPEAMRGTLPGVAWSPDEATGRDFQALMSWLSDPIPPAMLALMRVCREPGPARRGHCLAIADTLLYRSDSSLAVAMGADLIGRLGAPEQQVAARARRRQIEWWQLHSGIAEPDAADAPASFRALFAAWREPAAGELDVLREQVLVRGLPLEPPPEWETPRQRGRGG